MVWFLYCPAFTARRLFCSCRFNCLAASESPGCIFVSEGASASSSSEPLQSSSAANWPASGSAAGPDSNCSEGGRGPAAAICAPACSTAGACDSAAGGGAGSAAGSNSNCSEGGKRPAAATCASAAFTGGAPAASCANSNWSAGRADASAIAASILGAAAACTWLAGALLAPSSHSLEATPLRRLTFAWSWARASNSSVISGGATSGGLGSLPLRLYACQASPCFPSDRFFTCGNRVINSSKVTLFAGFSFAPGFGCVILSFSSSITLPGLALGGTGGPGFGPFACCG
jgi:hypothetical protein